jgi:hypothetical protein
MTPLVGATPIRAVPTDENRPNRRRARLSRVARDLQAWNRTLRQPHRGSAIVTGRLTQRRSPASQQQLFSAEESRRRAR